jgi:enoyl-CoA hydratase/carnithine racemase
MSQFAAQPAASVIPGELLYGVDGAIATITLDAPQRMNTISGPMLRQLTDEHVHHVFLQLLPLMQTEDMKEQTKAFLEKREPKFNGR